MRNAICISTLILILTGLSSCTEQQREAGFEDQISMTIYDYMQADENYSSFMKICVVGGISQTLSAYNPYGEGYTLFLPGNEAIDEFIANSDRFSSLDEMLKDVEYSGDFSRYHCVLLGIESNDFPFGALPEYTMSGDLLTVNFVIQEDSSYYKINNQAPVIRPNIELANGYVHIISSALTPINFTTYQWLEAHQSYSIFKEAVDATGLNEILSINRKDETAADFPQTLLVEPDSIYQKRNINSLGDLAAMISPGRTDYTDKLNPLHTYVAYHILTENKFLVDFGEISTNYGTVAEIPLNINGLGLDLLINKGKKIFDTLISGSDTTIIDYILFNYDESNVITQTGAVHFIDQLLSPQKPGRAIQTYEFYEEPLLNEYRLEPGSYLIDDTSALNRIKWSGADLIFNEDPAGEESPAWGADYLYIKGDFSISYRIPSLVQGKYLLVLRVEGLDPNNAVVEVFIDGKAIGGLVNLASGGTGTSPYVRKELGTVDLFKYSEHTIEIRSLIPGSLYWDYVRFEPI